MVSPNMMKARQRCADEPLGAAILEGIKREMPGIVVKEWDYTLDAPAMVIREGSAHAKASSLHAVHATRRG
jgi:hypothetical protein